ncbi:MAG TPA: hypothetical protein VEK73_08445 [Xanthobacteraceae bacterium]|nr:hypothetical protein [Xanthobacteraceae bacterium]
MLVAARGHVAQIEAEIAEVEQAEKALPPLRGAEVHVPTAIVRGSPPAPSHTQLTIKQLVMQALRAKHPGGFDTAQLREFIRDAYGRTIEPDSLRPQLVRLKSDDWIVARENIWYLTKRALVWDNPRSMNVKDEPSETDVATQRLRDLQDSVNATYRAVISTSKKGESPGQAEPIDLLKLAQELAWRPEDTAACERAEIERRLKEASDVDLARELKNRGLLGKVSVENLRAAVKKKRTVRFI